MTLFKRQGKPPNKLGIWILDGAIDQTDVQYEEIYEAHTDATGAA